LDATPVEVAAFPRRCQPSCAPLDRRRTSPPPLGVRLLIGRYLVSLRQTLSLAA
jgi:hypothetical protein